MSHKNIFFFLLFSSISMPKLAMSQDDLKVEVTIDSVTFTAFEKRDTGFSTFISRDLHAIYRKAGKNVNATLFKPGKFRTLAQDTTGYIYSNLLLDTNGLSISAFDSSNDPAFIKLSAGRINISSKQTWFNGDWIRLPSLNNKFLLRNGQFPEGFLSYNTTTKSLYSSNGTEISPSFWEWFDPKDSTGGQIWHDYSNQWMAEGGLTTIPIIRLRHPKNVTSVPYPTISEQKDYIIAPYAYGILHRYSGIMEWDVPEFSVRSGTMAAPLDLEKNGSTGWGGVFWVGDDVDKGGLRATSRRKDSVFYAEVSSEDFAGISHGALRLRVVDSSDQIQFVHGGRGSNRQFAYINRIADTVNLGIGQQLGLALNTSDTTRLFIGKEGLIGVNNQKPTSALDINGTDAFKQLRLRKPFTPASSDDPKGEVGDIGWDDSYIYIKTSTGWKRTSLESF